MINVNDNTILNPDNVVIAEQKGSMYKLTLINGKTLYVNKDVYEDIIVYEPVSKEYVDSKLSGTLKRLIVQALPTENIDTNTIYMILDPESVAPNNIYNEYMYISNAWELIGTTHANGVEVIANPTLSGGESSLSSLGVDGTNYVVGDKYYKHTCWLNHPTYGDLPFEFINKSNKNNYTIGELFLIMRNLGYNNRDKLYATNDNKINVANNTFTICEGIYAPTKEFIFYIVITIITYDKDNNTFTAANNNYYWGFSGLGAVTQVCSEIN